MNDRQKMGGYLVIGTVLAVTAFFQAAGRNPLAVFPFVCSIACLIQAWRMRR